MVVSLGILEIGGVKMAGTSCSLWGLRYTTTPTREQAECSSDSQHVEENSGEAVNDPKQALTRAVHRLWTVG